MSKCTFYVYRDNPEHREDKALALLAAARRGDDKIVRHFLMDDVNIIQEALPDSGSTVLHQATDEGLTSLFKVYSYNYVRPNLFLQLTSPSRAPTTLHPTARLQRC